SDLTTRSLTRISRGTLSPEHPGIYRIGIDPAGGRPGQPRLPKPAVFESTAALGLLPSRALSSGRTSETLSLSSHLLISCCLREPPRGSTIPNYTMSLDVEVDRI